MDNLSDTTGSFIYGLRKTFRRLLLLARGFEYLQPLASISVETPNNTCKETITSIRRMLYSVYVMIVTLFYFRLFWKWLFYYKRGASYLSSQDGQTSFLLDAMALVAGGVDNDEIDRGTAGIRDFYNGSVQGLGAGMAFVGTNSQPQWWNRFGWRILPESLD
ncbi:hypothetical protein BJ508DRAFT_333301 [Ascobolus immersus RN42]|uniref:Uncharacterized protein n=1 Tax=Ascobolus immersus RN42 TaxID=1160509 RepID=A0A3N4HJY1_ASCIM|nr:hypothetical protein BJ508DRAFT_333301 [Ascobolus immersus RN42]